MSQSPSITADTSMAELLVHYPGAQRALFAKYHIGGCASCGFRPDETLGGVCERNENIPVSEAIDHIIESHDCDVARQVLPADLKTHLEDSDPPAVLDLRTREEHENAKITSAELFSHDKLQDIMASWPKDRAIVVYDHLGENGAMDAAAYLEGHGFTNIRTLRGGIDAYAKEADSNLPRYRLEIA